MTMRKKEYTEAGDAGSGSTRELTPQEAQNIPTGLIAVSDEEGSYVGHHLLRPASEEILNGEEFEKALLYDIMIQPVWDQAVLFSYGATKVEVRKVRKLDWHIFREKGRNSKEIEMAKDKKKEAWTLHQHLLFSP
jgi:hypothetical protein